MGQRWKQGLVKGWGMPWYVRRQWMQPKVRLLSALLSGVLGVVARAVGVGMVGIGPDFVDELPTSVDGVFGCVGTSELECGEEREEVLHTQTMGGWGKGWDLCRQRWRQPGWWLT
jgi:hypothetical protein